MKMVGSYEAKIHLLRLLDKVARGERITITKHGIPVAQLVPAREGEATNVASVIEEIKRLRKGRSLGGLSLREMIDEGRRF